MEPITCRYPWYVRYMRLFMYGLGIIFPLFWMAYFIIRILSAFSSTTFEEIAWIVVMVVISALFPILTANLFPDIEADKENIYIHFLWYRLPVKWQDIIGIKPSWANIPRHPTTWVVSTRTLTPFHRFYGLLYAFTVQPSFIIRYEITDRDKLIRLIRGHCQVRMSKKR